MTDHIKKFADCCDDQLPTIATVGRGPKGDSSHVRVGTPDSCTETYIEGWRVDEITGERIFGSEWKTENINGGELKYQYNLRPYTNPRTFTITFIYRRPGRHEWSWTTPAIPYIWTVAKDDGTVEEKPDHIVGSGVATLFIREGIEYNWKERLNYPTDPDTGQPYPREFFNAPTAAEAWASTITFGIGGDVEIPNIEDLEKILGLNPGDIRKIINDQTITIGDTSGANVIDWVKNHMHNDQGFGSNTLVGDNKNSKLPASSHPSGVTYNGTKYTNPMVGQPYTIKNYIDWAVWEGKLDMLANLEAQRVQNNSIFQNLYGLLGDIVSKIFGASLKTDNGNPASGSINDKSRIDWTYPNAKIPVGELNIYSGNNAGGSATDWIRSRTDNSGNDLWAK